MWSPPYTRPISECLSSGASHNKALYKSPDYSYSYWLNLHVYWLYQDNYSLQRRGHKAKQCKPNVTNLDDILHGFVLLLRLYRHTHAHRRTLYSVHTKIVQYSITIACTRFSLKKNKKILCKIRIWRSNCISQYRNRFRHGAFHHYTVIIIINQVHQSLWSVWSSAPCFALVQCPNEYQLWLGRQRQV